MEKSSLGFQCFSKRVVRPATHLANSRGLDLPVPPLDHSRYLKLRDKDDAVVFAEEESQLVVTLLDLVFYPA